MSSLFSFVTSNLSQPNLVDIKVRPPYFISSLPSSLPFSACLSLPAFVLLIFPYIIVFFPSLPPPIHSLPSFAYLPLFYNSASDLIAILILLPFPLPPFLPSASFPFFLPTILPSPYSFSPWLSLFHFGPYPPFYLSIFPSFLPSIRHHLSLSLSPFFLISPSFT